VESLDGDLNFRWGFALPSDGALDGGHRVALDSRTSLYVTGWFAGTTDFDGGAGVFNLPSVNANGATDSFPGKYDRNGGFLWAHSFGGFTTKAADLSIPAGLKVDAVDTAYITGQYYGTNVTFRPYNPPGAMPDSLGQNDGLLVNYHADGQLADHELRVTGITAGSGDISTHWNASPNVKLQRTFSLSPANWQDVPGSLGQATCLRINKTT
jgi:hypothetical protein